MNCWVCDDAETTTAALATCPICGVGLCREHRLEQGRGVAGTAVECNHFNVSTRKETAGDKHGSAHA